MKILLSLALAAACAPAAALVSSVPDSTVLLRHITALSSDEFEGRAPATNGETVTIAYLQDAFKKLGLAPGNPDGSYLQPVPLMLLQSAPKMSYTAGGKTHALAYPDEVAALSMRAESKVELADSELVFVGYGVSAPEFKWDDFKGVDVRGKTLVMLINDPPVPDPKRPGQLDPAVFDGKATSWYGRWTYKFGIAARLGAAGVLIVHETRAAGYPWDAVRSTWSRPTYGIRSKADSGHPPLSGWLRLDKAKELFKAGGHDFDALKKAAASRAFKPVPLGIKADISVANAWGEAVSHNVVARIQGSDPALKDELVVYTAHWDHFGIDESLPGPRSKQIFHGAVDNASGVAGVLEIARAFKALPTPPRRSVLFLLTTAEERGMLGAQYYVRHPLYPLARTVLNINVDGLNLWGRTRDVELAGYGKSTADALVAAAARQQGRSVKRESNPEIGAFYRSDQFEFARAGVPAVFVMAGRQFAGRAGIGKQDFYMAQHYHTVDDVVQPHWDFGGALQDVALMFNAGYKAAQEAGRPAWLPHAEFRAAREAAGKGH